MQASGVFSKVDQPTDWCLGMVVVQKKSGVVRICVDLKPLNESIRREVYPMPHVDETLALLAEAKVFSKLDANSGFWAGSPGRIMQTPHYLYHTLRAILV